MIYQQIEGRGEKFVLDGPSSLYKPAVNLQPEEGDDRAFDSADSCRSGADCA